MPNPQNPITPFTFNSGQNLGNCQGWCEGQKRGGCCEFISLGPPQDCAFYPEGTSTTKTTSPSTMTLPCIQPPPPPFSKCGDRTFGPKGNICENRSPPPGESPYVEWFGLRPEQAILNCAAEGKTGCCEYRSDSTERARFYAGGKSIAKGTPNDATVQCTEPPPPPPRPPAMCQAFGRPGQVCNPGPNPDSNPDQWLYIEAEVCFAECAALGKTGCCEHRATGYCLFFKGGRVGPGSPDASAGLCLGPTCTTGLDFACGKAKREGVFQCGQCVGKAEAQLTQCSEAEEQAYCEGA